MPLLPPQAPDSPEGAFQHAFSQLAQAELDDPGVLARMTPEQRRVFALGTVRLEVASAGFEGYFLYPVSETALEARASAELLGPDWVRLLTDACAVFGSDYPVDQPSRETAVNELLHRDPKALEKLDATFDELEARGSADTRLDEYVWAHRAAIFG